MTSIVNKLVDDGIIREAESRYSVGHITIIEKSSKCSCGNYGYLEVYEGGKAFTHRAQEELSKGRWSQQINSEFGAYFGTAIASLVNLVNPSIVIIGGTLSTSGYLLLAPIQETVSKRSLLVTSNTVRISTALLGKRSTVIGAITQALSFALHETGERKQNQVS